MHMRFMVEIDVRPKDGQSHEEATTAFGDIFAEYLTSPESPFLVDYAPGDEGEREDGYPGPFAVAVLVTDASLVFTRDEVSAAFNAAAQMVADESNPEGIEWSRTIRDQSIIDALVNAGMTLLDNPGATFDEVAENYDADADEIREWIR